jgi:hypothetical protein
MAALGFFWMLTLLIDEEINCTAHRGSAYQECVRASDLNGMRIQAAIAGLAAFGFVLLVGEPLLRRGLSPSSPNPEGPGGVAETDERSEVEGRGPGWAPATSTGRSDLGVSAVAAVLSGVLLVGCVLTWMWGLQGGWAPERPFPYEPIANSEGNITILVGFAVGAVSGAALPLLRSLRRRSSEEENASRSARS